MLPTTVPGIDVSNHNGIFPWPQWNGHIGFAMVKATEGLTYWDPQFPANWEWMQDLGLFRFAYHYAHPELDPVKQAEMFVSFVRANGLYAHDNFVLDLENTGGMSPQEVSFWAFIFCREVNKLTGNRVLVYTYPAFAKAGNCMLLGDWYLWIAEYGVAQPDITGTPWARPGRRHGYKFWQYSGGPPLDHDRFNGNLDELSAFCVR